MRTLKRTVVVAVAIVALAAPAAASAWHFTFDKFFQISPSVAQAHKVIAEKCHGGKLGNYTLIAKHFILVDSSDDKGPFLQLDMRITLPVTAKLQKLKVTKFELDYENFPDEAANEIHDSLVPFFNKSKAKLDNSGKKLILENPKLVIADEPVLDAGKTTSPFNPKPGC
jgi:hypothetical protein